MSNRKERVHYSLSGVDRDGKYFSYVGQTGSSVVKYLTSGKVGYGCIVPWGGSSSPKDMCFFSTEIYGTEFRDKYWEEVDKCAQRTIHR